MTLTILSCYFNFNDNPWMQDNTRYCAQQWRKAGAHVVFVEVALHGTEHVFHPAIDEGDDDTRNIFHTLIQHHVDDIMWYKEMALNIALSHIPPSSSYVAWMDNDVFFAPPPDTGHTLPDTWWVNAIDNVFKQHASVVLLQPFEKVVLTTETVRNGLLGTRGPEDVPQPQPQQPSSPTEAVVRMTSEEAIRKCEKMARVRPAIMSDRKGGVTGCAWVARARHIRSCGFFHHAYVGGGDAVLLNLLQGAVNSRALPVVNNDMQRYYYQERGPFSRNLLRYRKKWLMHTTLPARFAYLPCTLLHLHHGELEKRTTHTDRFRLLFEKQFNVSRHVCANPKAPGMLMWSQAFRATGINSELLKSLERSQTVRDKVLLRVARTRCCLEQMKQQMTTLQHTEADKVQAEHKNHQQLRSLLQQCLVAFDSAGA